MKDALEQVRSKPARVFLVEDEGSIALMLEAQLQELGYRVAGHAGRASDAMRLIPLAQVDLILMDINLGEGPSGLDVAASVRETSDVPIVFLTAYSDDATIARAARIGAQGFLSKPVRNRELIASIEVALHVHATARRLAEKREADLRAVEVSMRAKSTLFASMSHELRAPIDVIHGMSVLALDTDPSAEQRDCLLKIDAASRSLRSVVDELIDLSRLEAGVTKLRRVPFEPADEIGRAFTRRLPVAKVAGAASERGSPAPTVAAESPRPAPPVLDAAGALARIGGNQILYRRLLATFTDRIGERAETLAARLDEGALEAAIQVAHELKGTSANLGLPALAAAAGALEVTLRAGERSPEAHHATLILAVDEAVTVARRWAAEGASPDDPANRSSGNPGDLRAMLAALEEPLRQRRPTPCKAIVAELALREWPARYAGLVDRLRDAVSRFRFDEAARLRAELVDEAERHG